MMSIIRPLPPPFALISFIAISAADTESIPYRPARPVIGYIAPMTIFSAATARSAPQTSSASPRASPFPRILPFRAMFPPFPGVLTAFLAFLFLRSALEPDHLLRLARLLRQVRLAEHHDPLRLRGSRPVQRLHQRGHRRHPLDVPAQLPLVLRGEPLLPGEIFLQQAAHLGAPEIVVGRQGRQEPP